MVIPDLPLCRQEKLRLSCICQYLQSGTLAIYVKELFMFSFLHFKVLNFVWYFLQVSRFS